MSEINVSTNNVREFPPPLRFTVRGQSFEVDLLSTIYALRDIPPVTGEEASDDPHRAYLCRVVALIKEQTGVELTAGEADWFNDQLSLEMAAAKKKRADAFTAALSSPSSTASTPAD